MATYDYETDRPGGAPGQAPIPAWAQVPPSSWGQAPGPAPAPAWGQSPEPGWGQAHVPIRPRRGSGPRWLAGGMALALALAGGGVAVHLITARTSSPAEVLTRPRWSGGGARGANDWTGWGSPDGGSRYGGGGGFGTGVTAAPASAAQQVGVVDINTVLGGQGARAAGTGMILTADGEVLTNRHVVDGETSMVVTVVATGRTYQATVVGTATQTDVAVVKMEGASGLTPVTTASQAVAVGDAVVGVGNAEGVGGTPSAAAGQVTALDQAITAMDEGGGGAERLTGLIETNAPIAPGDSGGPLFNASDQVVGMDTAGSARGAADAFAIPIGTALTAATQIESGAPGTTPGAPGTSGSGSNGSGNGGSFGGGTTSGRSAFLGVQVQDGFGGAVVVAVIAGSPAEAAGLTAGDSITSVGGRRVQSIADLSSAMATLAPGQQVAVTWTDQNGQGHQATATLASA
jgi:S1-C subfamily serine protease